MKITGIKPILISVPYRYGGTTPKEDSIPWHNMETLLLKLETDQGIIGWGEGFGFGVCSVTKSAVERMVVPLAIGRDPRDISGLMEDLSRKLHNYGRNGPVSFALSALDIALWDVAGQIEGKPLHIMLGGQPVKRMPAYASLLRYGNPDLVGRFASEAVSRGYKRVKLHEIREAEIAAARSAIGNEIKLMVDANCPWNAVEATSMAKAFEPYDLLWLEEPIWPPDDCHALAQVGANGGIVIAAGENGGTFGDMPALLDTARVEYVQPSVTKIGGVSAMMRVAELARTRGKHFAPHSPYFGPGLIASAHICAAVPEQPPVERFYCELEASPFGEQIIIKNGAIDIPQEPGLGLHIDEATIEQYKVE